jgi:transcriptional regulator with XRE-family HTH domain
MLRRCRAQTEAVSRELSELEARWLVARELRRARRRLRISQHSLSTLSGVPRATVSEIENVCVNPKLSTLTSLAAALDCDLGLSLRPRYAAAVRQAGTR